MICVWTLLLFTACSSSVVSAADINRETRPVLLKPKAPQPQRRFSRLRLQLLSPAALSYIGLSSVGAGAAIMASQVAGGVAGGAVLASVLLPAAVAFGEFLFFGGGRHVAQLMGGVPADEALVELVRQVAEEAQVPPPTYVYEIPTEEANAFAAGLGAGDTTVAVTRGLRDLLSTEELKAVIGHEIGHIMKRDVRNHLHISVALAGLGGLFAAGQQLLDQAEELRCRCIKDRVDESGAHYDAHRGRSVDDGRRANAQSRRFVEGYAERNPNATEGTDQPSQPQDDHVDEEEAEAQEQTNKSLSTALSALGLGLIVTGGLFRGLGELGRLALSRQNEFSADATAAKVVGVDPMVSALRKLEGRAAVAKRDALGVRNGLFSHFFIYNAPAALAKEAHGSWLERGARLLSTHPPTDKRVDALLRLSQARA